jgi:hypothetical protein
MAVQKLMVHRNRAARAVERTIPFMLAGDGRGVLRAGGREHLGDLGLAVRAELRRGDPGHAWLAAGQGGECRKACPVGGDVDLAGQLQGPVEAGPNPFASSR